MHKATCVFVGLLLAGCGGATATGGGTSGPGPDPVGDDPPIADDPPPVAADPCPQEMGVDAPSELAAATTLEGSTVGCFGVDDKSDAYVLTAPTHAGPVLYRLEIQGTDAEACVKALDADQAPVRGAEQCAARGAVKRTWLVVQGGTTWYLETRNLAGDGQTAAHPYTLAVEATPIDDAGEPDAADKAVALELGKPHTALFVAAVNAKDADKDYFSVVVPKDMKKKTKLTVSITGLTPDVQVAVKATHDKKGAIGEKGAMKGGEALEHTFKMKGPGTYTFELRNVAGSGTPLTGVDEPGAVVSTPYTITVSAP